MIIIYNLFIGFTERKIEISLRDTDGEIIQSKQAEIPVEFNGKNASCDAADIWVICAGTVREIAQDNPDASQSIDSIYLSGDRNGYVVLDESSLPVGAVILNPVSLPEHIDENHIILSPLSYIRFMLTGNYTAEESEYIIKNKNNLPDGVTGRVCDFSFIYFEITKQSAYLLKINRHIKVRTVSDNP